MKTYRPAFVGDAAIRREFEAVQKASLRADPLVALNYIMVAPDKPQDGLYLAAAGVLGVDRGLYRYDADSATYTFIA